MMGNAEQPLPVLSSRFRDALVYAAQKHAFQFRKSTQIPYIAHLMSVSALVLEAGGSEDEAIAALLHDAAEDQGGQPTLNEVGRLYGTAVMAIVDNCSDAIVDSKEAKPAWKERKEAYIAHLQTADDSTRLVSLADKLANARSILTDFQQIGDVVFKRFNAGKEETLWYYRALAEEFTRKDKRWEQAAQQRTWMASELMRIVVELEQSSNTSSQS